jgi:dipeptidyl aminopeptidase/acylaminoacyl peptidase
MRLALRAANQWHGGSARLDGSVGRPLELDDLFRLRLPSDPQLAPDGRRLAFVITTADQEEDANCSSIWLLDVDGTSAPVQVTQGPNDGAPRWSPDGTRLAFVAYGRGDSAELRVLPLAGGESEIVARGVAVSGPAWSPDGTRIAYGAVTGISEDPGAANAPIVTRRLGFKADGAGLIGEKRRHLFTVTLGGGDSDSGSGDPVQLTEGDFSVGTTPAWSPDGSRIAWAAGVDADSDLTFVTSVHVSDADGGAPKRVTEPPAAIAHVSWFPDGATLLLAGGERQEVGHTKLFTVPADGGALRRVAPAFDRNVMVGGPGYPGAPPRVGPDGRRIVFCARDAGSTHVYATDIDGEPEKILGEGDMGIAGVAVDDANDRIVVVASTATTAGDVFVGTEQRTALMPDAIDLLSAAARVFAAPDGTDIHGWVLRRDDAPAPGPVLLDVHGGPHNAWNGAFDGVHLYHQLLASQGWTVLFLNPRGSDGYGEDFYRAVAGGWGTSDTDDFLCALDALVADGVADPARIAITGYSYGGYMTCWLTARTDRFAAAIAGGCVSNLTSESGSADLGMYLAEFELGGLPPGEERLTTLSPITYVDDVTTPTLVLHGGADDRCPVGQGEEWFAALRVRRVEAEFVRYPGASHLFILSGRPSHRIDYNRRVAEWAVAHTLKGAH